MSKNNTSCKSRKSCKPYHKPKGSDSTLDEGAMLKRSNNPSIAQSIAPCEKESRETPSQASTGKLGSAFKGPRGWMKTPCAKPATKLKQRKPKKTEDCGTQTRGCPQGGSPKR